MLLNRQLDMVTIRSTHDLGHVPEKVSTALAFQVKLFQFAQIQLISSLVSRLYLCAEGGGHCVCQVMDKVEQQIDGLLL